MTVGDSQGLSYYSDTTLGKRLSMDSLCLKQARDALVRHRLVAYRKPIYQVLALDCRRESIQADSEPTSLGQILEQLAGGGQ